MSKKRIPTSEIKQDILDTQAEIVEMRNKVRGYLLIGDKLSDFKATGFQNRINRRIKFIGKLKAILKTRKTK